MYFIYVINTGFEERSEPNVQLWEDKGDAGPAGRWSQPDDRPPRGGEQGGQCGRHQRRLPEDDARRDRQVLDYDDDNQSNECLQMRFWH